MWTHAKIIGAIAVILLAFVCFFVYTVLRLHTEDTAVRNEQSHVISFTQNNAESLFERLLGKKTTPQSDQVPEAGDFETPLDIRSLLGAWYQRAATSSRAQSAITPKPAVTEASDTDITSFLNSFSNPTRLSGEYSSDAFNYTTNIIRPRWSSQSDNTTNSVVSKARAYGNALGTILERFELTLPDESAVLQAALTEKSEESKQRVRDLARKYTAVGEELSNVVAPEGFRETGVAFVNGYLLVGEYLESFATITTDKEARQVVSLYSERAAIPATKAAIALITLFAAHAIVFESYEPGAMFNIFTGNL